MTSTMAKEVSNGSVTLINSTAAFLEVQVTFVAAGTSIAAQRVGGLLAPGMAHCFKPSTLCATGETPLKAKTIYLHGVDSPAGKTVKYEVDAASDAGVFDVCSGTSGGDLVVAPASDGSTTGRNAVPGAPLSSLTMNNNSSGFLSVKFSTGAEVSLGAGSELPVKLSPTCALHEILVKSSSSPTPVVHVVFSTDKSGGDEAAYEVSAWPSVGLTVSPKPLPLNPAQVGSSLAGAAAKQTSAGKVPVTKRAADKLDQRKSHGGGLLDAFIDKVEEPEKKEVGGAQKAAESDEAAAPGPELPPSPPVDDTPDNWDEGEDEVPASGAQPAEASALPPPSLSQSSGVAPPLAPAVTPVSTTTTGSLRPGGRMLRPGGASLRPGGGAGGYKGGAGGGSSESTSGSGAGGAGAGGGSSAPIKIEHRYTKEELLELMPPPSAAFPQRLKMLPSYELRSPSSGGGHGGGGGKGGSDQWGRGTQQSGGGGKGGGKGGGAQGGGGNWQGGAVGGCGGAGVGGGQQGGQWERRPQAAVPQLSKSKNPFLFGSKKQTKDETTMVESKLVSILNKLTPQTYEKLRAQLLELPIDRGPLLKMLIGKIFDKVVDEAAFSEIYARLCADLDKAAPHHWRYVKVVADPSEKQFYWAADVSTRESELMGPYDDEQTCFTVAAAVAEGEQEVPLSPPPPGTVLASCVKHGEILVKVFRAPTSSQCFMSFDAFSSLEQMAERDMAGGPFQDTAKHTGAEEALKRGNKATTLKRMLLNRCQEAFETDDIYAEIARKYTASDFSKLSPKERAEGEEAREMSTLRAKKHMLGNIRFVGELYKLPKMLQDKVIHSCVQKLLHVTNENEADGTVRLGKNGQPELFELQPLTAADEENIEALCRLLQTIGAKLEEDCAKDPYKQALMELYLLRLQRLGQDRAFPSRMRFMVQDYFELRKNAYVPRRKEDKQMTQEQIRSIAAREMDGGGGKGLGNAGGGGSQGGKGGGKGGGGKGGGQQQQQQQYQQSGHQQQFSGGHDVSGGRRGGGDARGGDTRGGDGGGGKGARQQHQQQSQHQQNQQQQQHPQGGGGKGGKQHGDVRVMQRHGQQGQQGQQGGGGGQRQSGGGAVARPQPPQGPSSNAARTATAPPARAAMGPEQVKALVVSFVSDWCNTSNEEEAGVYWAELLGKCGGALGAVCVEVCVERAAEAKPAQRQAIAALLELMSRKKSLVEARDVLPPLRVYLEFLEDNLCDVPTLHSNLAEVDDYVEALVLVLGPLVNQGGLSVSGLEQILRHYQAQGDPTMMPKTVADFFSALNSFLAAAGNIQAAGEAQAAVARSM